MIWKKDTSQLKKEKIMHFHSPDCYAMIFLIFHPHYLLVKIPMEWSILIKWLQCITGKIGGNLRDHFLSADIGRNVFSSKMNITL